MTLSSLVRRAACVVIATLSIVAFAPPARADVLVLPMHGQVGRSVGAAADASFSATLVQQVLDDAHAREADLVILDIDSPGGLVSEMEDICDLIQDYARDVAVVAYPHDAFSAAAVITLSCRQVVAHPDSRIGAAVIITRDAKGTTAVDAKMASPHYAKQRQLMEKSGHPYPVIEAMTIQDAELWWSPKGGFTTSDPGGGTEWEKVDTASTVLTMTADQAVRWEIAEGQARRYADVARMARGLSPDEYELVNLKRQVERTNRDYDRNVERFVGQVLAYFRAIGTLRLAIDGMADAINKGDEAVTAQMRIHINRQVTAAEKSRRAIQSIDRGFFQTRFSSPDVVIDRIKDDAALLKEIRTFTRGTSVAGFNKAVDRFNEMVEAWQTLIAELEGQG